MTKLTERSDLSQVRQGRGPGYFVLSLYSQGAGVVTVTGAALRETGFPEIIGGQDAGSDQIDSGPEGTDIAAHLFRIGTAADCFQKADAGCVKFRQCTDSATAVARNPGITGIGRVRRTE